jgi:hypothetical protein
MDITTKAIREIMMAGTMADGMVAAMADGMVAAMAGTTEIMTESVQDHLSVDLTRSMVGQITDHRNVTVTMSVSTEAEARDVFSRCSIATANPGIPLWIRPMSTGTTLWTRLMSTGKTELTR